MHFGMQQLLQIAYDVTKNGAGGSGLGFYEGSGSINHR
jgi:hypothetical protein